MASILVTGGSRGIGRAVVVAAAAAGHRCGIISRGAADETVAAVRASGGHQPVLRRADVTDDAACRTAVESIADELDGLDVVVNNAARVSGTEPDDVFTVAYDLLRADFEEKVVGYLRVVRAAYPYLARSAAGRVVNIGGEAARVARANVSSGIRNSAVVHLTHTLAQALGPDGITVNAVHPGVVTTEANRQNLGEPLLTRLAGSHALRRLATPQEVADTVLFLASPAASGVTAQVVCVSAGSSRAVHH